MKERPYIKITQSPDTRNFSSTGTTVHVVDGDSEIKIPGVKKVNVVFEVGHVVTTELTLNGAPSNEIYCLLDKVIVDESCEDITTLDDNYKRTKIK